MKKKLLAFLLTGILMFAGSISVMAEEADAAGAGNNGSPAAVQNNLPEDENAKSEVLLSQESLKGIIGTTVDLTAVVLPEGSDQSVIWSSSAPKIASVDENGSVMFMDVGEAVITATAADGAFAQCSVKVLEPLYMEEALNTFLSGSMLLELTKNLPDDCKPYREVLDQALNELNDYLWDENHTIEDQPELDALVLKAETAEKDLAAYISQKGYEIGFPYVISYYDFDTNKKIAKDKTGKLNLIDIDWTDENAVLEALAPADIKGYEWLEDGVLVGMSKDGTTIEISYYYQAVKDPGITDPPEQKPDPKPEPKPDPKPTPEKPDPKPQDSGMTNVPKTNDHFMPYAALLLGICAAGTAVVVQKKRKSEDIR